MSIVPRRMLWIGRPPERDDIRLIEAAGMQPVVVASVADLPRDGDPPDLVVVVADDGELGLRIDEVSLWPRSSLLVALTATASSVPTALASGADDAMCMQNREEELWARVLAWARAVSRDRVRVAALSSLEQQLAAAKQVISDLQRENARLRRLLSYAERRRRD